jgi:hypothetical protein
MTTRLTITLRQCIPTILDEWARRARGSEIESICAEEREGNLAEVLRAMSLALGPHQPGSRAVDEFIETAAVHGARRRSQGIRETCLFEEYDLLGAAMPHAMRACQEGPLAPEDLLMLEGGLTTAILAGLRGFHRGELERRGPWTDTLARVVNEASELSSGAANPPRSDPQVEADRGR